MSEGQSIANAIDHYSSNTTQFPKPRRPRPASTFFKLSTAASNLLSSAQNAKVGTFVFVVTIHDFRSAESGTRMIGVYNDHEIAREALDRVLRERRYKGARIWRRDMEEADDGVEVNRGHVHDVVGIVGRMVVR